MTEFSSRVERISISGIRKVFEAAGEDAINLGLGQPDFQTPAHARQAAIDAINDGLVDAYTQNKGTESLRERPLLQNMNVIKALILTRTISSQQQVEAKRSILRSRHTSIRVKRLLSLIRALSRMMH